MRACCCAGRPPDACADVTLMWRQVFVLDRVLEEDGVTGDAYGPYDADFVAEERERLQRDKVGEPVTI